MWLRPPWHIPFYLSCLWTFRSLIIKSFGILTVASQQVFNCTYRSPSVAHGVCVCTCGCECACVGVHVWVWVCTCVGVHMCGYGCARVWVWVCTCVCVLLDSCGSEFPILQSHGLHTICPGQTEPPGGVLNSVAGTYHRVLVMFSNSGLKACAKREGTARGDSAFWHSGLRCDFYLMLF